MSVRRLLSNISSDRLQESRDFYADLLGMEVAFESDWYIRLHSPTNPGLELGIIQRDHPLLPADWRAVPVGMYLTFVVDNVDDIHARAVVRGLPIVQPLLLQHGVGEGAQVQAHDSLLHPEAGGGKDGRRVGNDARCRRAVGRPGAVRCGRTVLGGMEGAAGRG